nr:MAG TPA: hypothetical protein [Caudoviricetes sp.]
MAAQWLVSWIGLIKITAENLLFVFNFIIQITKWY